MASVIAGVVGQRVVPVSLPYALFTKVARSQGVDPFTVDVFLRYLDGDMKAGVFEFEGGVSEDLEYLTGAPAESFEVTARRYAAMPFARQTAANRARAFAKFMATPLLPGYSFDRLRRQWSMPVPPNPSLGVEDEQWRREHHAMMNRRALRTDAAV
jgi:hypothetical protein